MKRTLVLVVLDGWGLGAQNESNPIHVVAPENYRHLSETYPVTSLQASGISVGLPWGETGNSEVGHLTLGAGKVVYQYYPKITMSVQDGSFFENPVLKSAFDHAKKHNSAVNLVGLLTRANTHASLDHLQALLRMADEEQLDRINLHLFADGLDSTPRTLPEFLQHIPREKLATLTGRYYAMDRNQKWDLTQKTVDTLLGNGTQVPDLEAALTAFYKRNGTEEYLPPMQLQPARGIKPNDAVIFFNFREDSIRQLAEALGDPKFNKFSYARPENLHVATLTRYEDKLSLPFAYAADSVTEPLGKVLADKGLTQLRLAETYKYAHVTYFFNGSQETPYENEYRVMVPSLSVPHPEERPELMASAITDRLVEAIQNHAFDFVLANYSNPDTIGHTGNYNACLAAVRVIDAEIGRLLRAVESDDNTTLIITSDHGNIEQVLNPETGEPETKHDPNPVPFHLVGTKFKNRKFANWRDIRNETMGILSDVAPTVLSLMDLPPAADMSGQNLLRDLLA